MQWERGGHTYSYQSYAESYDAHFQRHSYADWLCSI